MSRPGYGYGYGSVSGLLYSWTQLPSSQVVTSCRHRDVATHWHTDCRNWPPVCANRRGPAHSDEPLSSFFTFVGRVLWPVLSSLAEYARPEPALGAEVNRYVSKDAIVQYTDQFYSIDNVANEARRRYRLLPAANRRYSCLSACPAVRLSSCPVVRLCPTA